MNPSTKFLSLSVVLTSLIFGVLGQPDEKLLYLQTKAAMEAGCYSASYNETDGKQAIGDRSKRWSDGVVPYTLDKWDSNQLSAITEGMAMVSEYTCIQFKKRTTEKNYIHIVSGEGCSSLVGSYGGRQKVTLGAGCYTPYIVAHELMHAIGIHHEQGRTDRDKYIEVITDNIVEKYRFAFAIKQGTKTFGLPYDFESIMHYPARMFAIDPEEDTMISKVPGKHIPTGYVKKLSVNDVKKLNALYECDSK